jgi:CHASE2 domain-containing sensor protein
MSKRSSSPILITCFLVVLVFAGLSFYKFRPLERVEKGVYILESRLSLEEGRSDQKIMLVEIDQRSINLLGSWPWPRHLLAEMVDLLRSGGATLICLDVPVMERQVDRSLEGLKRFRQKIETLALSTKDPGAEWIQEDLARLQESADDDQQLVNTIRQQGNVILPVMSRLEKGQRGVATDRDAILSRDFLGERNISPELKEAISVDRLFLPFPKLAQAASGLGYVSSNPREGGDGVSYRLVFSYDGSLLPSLPLRAAIAYMGLQPRQVVVEKGEIKLKGQSIPLTRGKMWIKFNKGMLSYPTYSFADLLHAPKLPSLIAGRVALIGCVFTESGNLKTPFSQNISDLQMTACVLENILNRSVMRRPSYLFYVEILAILIIGAFGSLFFPRMGQLGRLGLTLALVALIFGTAFALLAMMGVWLKSVYIAGCIFTLYIIVSASQLAASGWVSMGSTEVDRAVGLAFQKEGLLDLAFGKFRQLPMDDETKLLLYNLGIGYEAKQMTRRALSVYKYIRAKGSFKDIDARILKLTEADDSSFVLIDPRISGSAPVDAKPIDERTRVGRFEILGVLGRGSVSVVLKALDPKLNRLLALKTLRFLDEFDEDVIEEIKARFFREAEIAGKLYHPSIVTIHELGEDGDLTYLAMEFLDGIDLEKFVTKDRLLPFFKVLRVVMSVAEALEYAHRANVIHRDIKPANIMLLKSGGVKVTDFGIAKAISSSRTKTGVILGTPNYMSPEQIMGQRIDYRSDIFSLGVLFFQLLTGELPFQGDNLSSLLYQITQTRHPKLRDFNPKLPAACDQIIDKALTKNPGERFKSAGEMASTVRLLASKIEHAIRKRPNQKRAAPKIPMNSSRQRLA